jgi:hypothetical protein
MKSSGNAGTGRKASDPESFYRCAIGVLLVIALAAGSYAAITLL